jgi:phosphatidylserine synthase
MKSDQATLALKVAAATIALFTASGALCAFYATLAAIEQRWERCSPGWASPS